MKRGKLALIERSVGGILLCYCSRRVSAVDGRAELNRGGGKGHGDDVKLDRLVLIPM
jgi:hypothetical protein